jgi:hypothetical protein
MGMQVEVYNYYRFQCFVVCPAAHILALDDTHYLKAMVVDDHGDRCLVEFQPPTECTNGARRIEIGEWREIGAESVGAPASGPAPSGTTRPSGRPSAGPGPEAEGCSCTPTQICRQCWAKDNGPIRVAAHEAAGEGDTGGSGRGMKLLLDQSERATDTPGIDYGQLLTPLTRYRRWAGPKSWAIDNGAFSRFDGKAFASLLKREREHRAECLFVCAPDVVGDARRTLEVFTFWSRKLLDQGWPVALVLQDGIENLEIPWERIAAVFIGGSTEFKQGPKAMACAKAAKLLGKWVHVGRVNTPTRWDYWQEIADSCDGTGLSRYTHMRQAVADGLPLLVGEEQR